MLQEMKDVTKSNLTCVMVLVGYMLAGPTIFINYITWLLWRPYKLLLSNYGLCLASCKWQPPWSPFASALVTDWYQYSGCPAMHACMAPLYKRAGLPSPWLTFWLNVTWGTSRSKARNLTLTLTRLSVHSTHTRYLICGHTHQP